MDTNKYSLPAPMCKALSVERKKPVFGRYSVTDIIDSPLRRCLKIKHNEDVDYEISDGLWALLGKAAHHILDSSTEGQSEIKIEVPYNGVTLVGVLDYIDKSTVIDYKVTSVWSYLLGEKPEWERQLNVYAFLYEQSHITVNKLEIYMILRDWKKMDYIKDSERYPPIPFVKREIRLWSTEEVIKYVDERIALHLAAEECLKNNEEIPVCTPEERWQRPTTFAIAKGEKDRALRVLDTLEEAETYFKEKKLSNDYKIYKRIGQDIRCLNYCQFYPKFCGGAQ